MARIVLNTFGSLGDLHPYLALALGLQRRGHQPVIATSKVYRAKVEAEGIPFAAVRPDVGELLDRPEFLAKLWDPKLGTEYLIRDYLIPQVEAGFKDLLETCRDADLVLTHAAAYAGPIVGELLGLRWISVALQPAVFFSATDPAVVAPAPWLRYFYWLGPWFYRVLLGIAERRITGWSGPIVQLRQRLGLPLARLNPVTRGQFSPHGSLALFSHHLGAGQPDWPVRTRQTGFLFYDRLGQGMPGSAKQGRDHVSADLAQFLEADKPPILFTLGSSAVMQPGSFFAESLNAIELLGERAILLVGHKEQADLRTPLPKSVFVADYVPFSEVMPRVAAIVHQGGIGTTAQSLRAGKPMLVVPWAHDQPDNAERLRKLGVGRWIPRNHYRGATVARALRALLDEPRHAQRASTVAAEIQNEDGEANACKAVDEFLSTGPDVNKPLAG